MEVLLIIVCVLVALICLAIIGYILFRPAVPKQETPLMEMRPEEDEEGDGGDADADDGVTDGEKAAEVSAEDENAPDADDTETSEEEVRTLENGGAVTEDIAEDDAKNGEE